jgi:hypothetical protein
MARGLSDLKIDLRRSSASLCAITAADQRLPVFLAPVFLAPVLLVPLLLAPTCLPGSACFTAERVFFAAARARVGLRARGPFRLLLVALMRNDKQQYSCRREWHAGTVSRLRLAAP